MQEAFQLPVASPKICIFIHKFSVFLHAALTFRISAMNASTSPQATALIYLEVHEEIFNEITSCLCVSDVRLLLPNLEVYSAEI